MIIKEKEKFSLVRINKKRLEMKIRKTVGAESISILIPNIKWIPATMKEIPIDDRRAIFISLDRLFTSIKRSIPTPYQIKLQATKDPN